MDIKYKVDGQKIIRKELVSVDLIPGTFGIARLVFDFDQSWSEFKQRAVLFGFDQSHMDVVNPMTGNTCMIPDKFCNEDFYFKIIGQCGKRRVATEARKVVVR